jgi:hypothetical protein
MASSILVDSDIEMGREAVQILDGAKFPVTGAAWIYFSDADEWRLVIRTPVAGRDLRQAYLDLALALDKKGDLRERLNLARVKLVPPNDRMLQAMGSAIKIDGLNQVRFSSNVVNGIYIDDALIYRLAA